MCVCVCVCTHTHTRVHTHTSVHTHTHTHTHTRAQVELRDEDKTHVAVKACNLLHTSASGALNKSSERMRAASTERRGVVESTILQHSGGTGLVCSKAEAPGVDDYSYGPSSHQEHIRRSSEERQAVSNEGREGGGRGVDRQHRRSSIEASGSNMSKERRTASTDSTEGVSNFDFDQLQRRYREMQPSRRSSRHAFSKVRIQRLCRVTL